jgi:chemotaxis regulatin CheY-phosphate phosphatase CheZ
MKPKELKLLLRKVEELKALLVFTERTIPFLEDVIAFVRDIVPMVEELKSSVAISSDKLPKASRQLDKVSTATELATTEILNTVEGMLAKTELITRDLTTGESYAVALNESAADVEKALKGRETFATTEAWRDAVQDQWAKHRLVLSARAQESASRPVLEGIQNDCTNIMIALQVQDITAQQIAAVNKLMQSVDEGLGRLLHHFSQVPSEHNRRQFEHKRLNISFDTDAEYSTGEDRQRLADEVVASAQQGGKVRGTQKKRKPRATSSGH